jgi:hypothetical protein
MPHLYFCIDSTCNKTVDYYNAPCCLEHNPLVQGNEETLSHETSECPGCGNDMYCSANGYCANCWVERFGCESPIAQWDDYDYSEHACSGEWDYDRGIRVCDDDDYHRKKCESYEYVDFPQRPNSVVSHRERVCASCDEHFTSKDQSTCCGECHLDAADVIQTWWRKVREPEPTAGCWGCRDECLNQQGHMHPGGCLYEESAQLPYPCHECGNTRCFCAHADSPSEAD